MKVNYFDLGLCDAAELIWMVDVVLPELRCPYRAYGFEACRRNYDKCKREVGRRAWVSLHEMAIAGREGEARLHHTASPMGHSIFESKGNLLRNRPKSGRPATYEMVPCTRLSVFISDNGIDLSDSFNILRYNIEGAEWPLFNDLHETGLLGKFHVFCGAEVGKDMRKVGELRDKADEHEKLLRENGVTVHFFADCHSYPESKDGIRDIVRHEYEKHCQSAS